MKKFLKILACTSVSIVWWCVVACATVVTAIVVVFMLSGDGDVYQTNDIADYGNIVGNYDNETPKEFIFSFFPETIESYFEQPQYHYKAIKGDSYAYEICLEFSIKDQQIFDDYVRTISAGKEAIPFVYDQKYTDFTISNDYHGNSISNAGIGKILVDEELQQIIYIATGTYDGGFATRDDLNYYWTRFGT